MCITTRSILRSTPIPTRCTGGCGRRHRCTTTSATTSMPSAGPTTSTESLLDNATFISGRGGILDFIRANLEMPPAMFIYTDPPIHTGIERCCTVSLRRAGSQSWSRRSAHSAPAVWTPSSGRGGSTSWPTSVPRSRCARSGMLLGIPESEQDSHRQDTDQALRAEPGEQLKPMDGFADGAALRRVHRLASRPPLRRSDDRPAERQARGGGRDFSPIDA